MLHKLRAQPRRLLGLATVAVLATVGVATAAIPSADGTIKVCYATSSGTPRIVDEAVTCRTSEQALTWNQRGAQGVPGEPGREGPEGPEGPAGKDGADGTAVISGQTRVTSGSATGCNSVQLATANIHLDKPSTLHVEASAVAVGHSDGRVGQMSVSVRPAGGGFGGQVQGSQVPVGNGSELTTVDGFVTSIGSGPHTFEAGDYVLTLDGQALGLCTPSQTEFEPGAAPLAWFTAQ